MLKSGLYDSLHRDLGDFLSPNELVMIADHNKIVSFSKGQTILHQGKYSNGIYLITDGVVNLTAKTLGEGTIASLGILEHGHFMGEASFIEDFPCQTSMIAKTDVQCILMTRIYMDFLTAYFPEVKYHLFSAIAKQVCLRIKEVHDRITNIISSTDMAERPLFGEIIQSLTKPVEITGEKGAHELNHLRSYSVLRSFDANEIDELLKHAILLKAPKNCTLIHKGDKKASCYIVIHGAVQSSIVHDNKIAKLSVIGPSTLFSSIACIDTDSAYTVSFATCEESVLLELSEKTLTLIMNEHPNTWYKLYDLICRSLVALEKSIYKLDIRLNVEIYNR